MKSVIGLLMRLVILVLVVAVISCAKEVSPPEKTALDFIIRDIRNNVVNLSQYKGDVVLIINTATECGLTPQFIGLQKLYENYRDKGLVILGFPSNSFKQENKTEEEIIIFCSDNFLVDFPMFGKVDVKGPEQHEIYKYLTDPATNPQFQGIIRWNFEKFLIGRDGQIVGFCRLGICKHNLSGFCSYINERVLCYSSH